MPYHLLSRRAVALTSALLVASVAFGCAPQNAASDTASDKPSSCAISDLAVKKKGTLTVGTDKPAYDPWFADNDPTNGKGFESAVAYAVAEQLGFDESDVKWTTVPFNSSYAPGPKDFDFDINQISITKKREKAVDFSHGYYTVNQAVVAMKNSKAGHAMSIADLKSVRLGAQVGTTSLSYITKAIDPKQQPRVYNDTNDAKSALTGGTVDAIVVDLPTAFYLTSAEIKGSTIVGQFEPTGNPEEFGLLFEKGSKLVPCVNKAIDELEHSGKLARIQHRWLSKNVDVPVLK
ncbi:MAG: transporter substrate-binding domain-containing protein [Streptosporangiales bacterium]